MMLPSKHIQKTALAVALSVSLFACGGSDNDDDGPAVIAPETTTVNLSADDLTNGAAIEAGDVDAVVAAGTVISTADGEVNADDIESIAVSINVVVENADGLEDEADLEAAAQAAISEAAASAGSSEVLEYDSVVQVKGIVTIAGQQVAVEEFNPPVTVTVPFDTAVSFGKLRAGCESYRVKNGAGNILGTTFSSTNDAIEFLATKPDTFTAFGVNCPVAPTGGESESN